MVQECKFTNKKELDKNYVERGKHVAIKISVSSRKEINLWFYMIIRNKEGGKANSNSGGGATKENKEPRTSSKDNVAKSPASEERDRDKDKDKETSDKDTNSTATEHSSSSADKEYAQRTEGYPGKLVFLCYNGMEAEECASYTL